MKKIIENIPYTSLRKESISLHELVMGICYSIHIYVNDVRDFIFHTSCHLNGMPNSKHTNLYNCIQLAVTGYF